VSDGEGRGGLGSESKGYLMRWTCSGCVEGSCLIKQNRFFMAARSSIQRGSMFGLLSQCHGDRKSGRF